MQFIDYVPLLLINMAAGLVLLAAYVAFGVHDARGRRWAPGFIMTGAVALAFGTHMALTWPLPGPYGAMFGEMTVLFGVIFLAAGLVLALGGDMVTVAGYAFFAGLAAVLLGVRIVVLSLTQLPLLSAAGFVLAGLGGVGALPFYLWFRNNRVARVLAALVLLAAAGIWALTGYLAYWIHPGMLSHWMPK
ncbi:MAG TPA: DUF981 domain-containing protein [Armatimonadota bacterium]|jgi:putative membrane protein